MTEQMTYLLLGMPIGAIISAFACRAYYRRAAVTSEEKWVGILSGFVHRHAADIVFLTQGPVEEVTR